MGLTWYQFEGMFKRGCPKLINTDKCSSFNKECNKDNCNRVKELEKIYKENGFVPFYMKNNKKQGE